MALPFTGAGGEAMGAGLPLALADLVALPALGSMAFGVWWTLMGLFVGSFLNVCIHRLPLEGASVWRPLRSHCPKCNRQLTWSENVPVLSWALQRGRCRGCGTTIQWRYPLDELLGAGACWVAWALLPPGGSFAILAVHTVVLSGLIVATFVDFDRWEIPDEVSIGGMWAALIVSALLPELHAAGPIARRFTDGAQIDWIASLMECGAGMALWAGILYSAYRTDAMGFGDVKLMAAGGGFIGSGGIAAALLIAVVAGSIVGVLNILRFYCVVRRRQRTRPQHGRGVRDAIRTARVCGRYLPFGPYLALGIGIVLLDWKDVMTLQHIGG